MWSECGVALFHRTPATALPPVAVAGDYTFRMQDMIRRLLLSDRFWIAVAVAAIFVLSIAIYVSK